MKIFVDGFLMRVCIMNLDVFVLTFFSCFGAMILDFSSRAPASMMMSKFPYSTLVGESSQASVPQ